MASAFVSGATVFTTVFPSLSNQTAMLIFAAIMILYTFLGGFKAVCWTDFFQGLLMLGSLFAAPIVALCMMQKNGTTAGTLPAGYWNMMTSWQDILSGLGWGLGYAGMPHIIIRFMSVKSDKELKKAAKVGIGWTFFILMFAVLVSVVAHLFLGDGQESSTIFIAIVRRIFTGPWLGLISGLLLSAILAGAMSTADSQLLAASSAFASDVYKPVIRKGQSTDKEMLWVGRIVVLVIAAAALLIASNPGSGTIMSLVENAWGIFGASFGPVIVLSLFWRGFTFSGAAAGIVAGAVVDVLWLVLFKSTGVYEIVPGFAAGLLAAVIASKCSSAESRETAAALFDQCIAYKD